MRQATSRSTPARARLATLVALLLTACGDDRPAGETADSAVAWSSAPFDSGRVDSSTGTLDTASADSAELTGEWPSANDPSFVLVADSIAGRGIYNGAGTCFTCHALDGAGVPPLGSDLRDSTWTHIDGSLNAIARVIRDGIPVSAGTRRGMPAFGSRLSEEDISRLAAYTYSLSHPGSVVSDTTFRDSAALMFPDSTVLPR